MEPFRQPPEPWVARVYDQWGAELYRHALVILADAGLAEDAVQQAFMKLLNRGNDGDIEQVRGYLHAIVRHEAYRLLPRRPAAQNLEETELLELQGNDVECGEERDEVARALRQLPAEQREVVHLKLWEGMTFDAMGKLLGVSLNTAASRYRYALWRLRELLPKGMSHE